MATYFSGSDNQKDSSPMHYSKEPLPNSYSEVPGNMMMYMNYASSSGSYSDTLAGNLQQPDINPVAEPDSNSSQQQILSNIGGSGIGLHDFNSWKDGRNEMVLMQQPEGSSSGAQILQGQGLSLSLGTQVSPGFQIYRDHNSGFSSFLGGSSQLISGDNDDTQSRQSRNVEYTPHGFPGTNSDAKTYMAQYGMSSIVRTLSNSKYLKAAQQLLDEVVNVRIAVKDRNSKKELSKDRKEKDAASKDGSSDPPQESSSNCHELSSAEKQDLQNKLTKLLSMLDEVDSRYKQYYHQMQLVVSSFDGVAGTGAAKPYTALALQTISRHFRCLRDAINGQIVLARRSLGEQDATSNSKGLGISRLRYVDQQLRQQRALQQLGMMQQHAWRPQRGLPENAVTILRAWLFEHFLHPYPKDSDKIMLARQTGLTRGQVSNWFINARVRLWKPMVEEMYKEETGDAEMDPTSSSAEIAPQATKSDTKVSEDRGEDKQQSETSTAMEQCFNAQFFESKSDNRRDTEINGSNSKAVFQNIPHTEDQRPIVDGSHIFPGTIGQSHESSDSFVAVGNASYHMTELERFGNGNRNGVSLTLGLQHCDGGNHSMSLSDHHNFNTMRGDDVYNPAPSSMGSEAADFDCLESGNRQQRFGSSHLFHDFVA